MLGSVLGSGCAEQFPQERSCLISGLWVFEIQGGNPDPATFVGVFFPMRSVAFSSLMFSVGQKSISSASETDFVETGEYNFVRLFNYA